MTAYAAVGGIREVDPAGSITLISEESDMPYQCPPLSKNLWAGERLETIERRYRGDGYATSTTGRGRAKPLVR